MRFIISLTDAHTHLDGITVIAGGVLDVLRRDAAKTFIVVTSGGYRSISSSNRANVTCNVIASGLINNKSQNVKSLAYRFEPFNSREICGAWTVVL